MFCVAIITLTSNRCFYKGGQQRLLIPCFFYMKMNVHNLVERSFLRIKYKPTAFGFLYSPVMQKVVCFSPFTSRLFRFLPLNADFVSFCVCYSSLSNTIHRQRLLKVNKITQVILFQFLCIEADLVLQSAKWIICLTCNFSIISNFHTFISLAY